MALDFPTSPTNGQQVTNGGTTWQWSSTDGVWLVVKPVVVPDAPADGKIYGRKDNTWVDSGERVIARYDITTTTATPIILAVPSGLTELKFSGQWITTLNSVVLGMQCSVDGGATYISTNSYNYQQISGSSTGSTAGSNSGVTNLISLSGTSNASPYLGLPISAIYYPGRAGQVATCYTDGVSNTFGGAGVITLVRNAYIMGFTNTVTHLKIFPSGGSIGAGTSILVRGW